jgi:hypothetical protein
MDDRIVRLAALQEAGEDLSPTTEEAMALEFADRHGHELRYVAAACGCGTISGSETGEGFL